MKLKILIKFLDI